MTQITGPKIKELFTTILDRVTDNVVLAAAHEAMAEHHRASNGNGHAPKRTYPSSSKGKAPGGATGPTGPTPKIASPAQRKARMLQGQYMGSMRNLSKADVAKVKREKAAKSYEAAIALAKRLKAKS